MPVTVRGYRICFPGPPPLKGQPPNPPICYDMREHGFELIRHASADLDPRLLNVSILFSMYELANQLNDEELRNAILSSVTGGIENFAAQLPAGVQLHFDGKTYPSRSAAD
ncbi:hypothetical protein LMG28614_06006 [Paraburkholderia ultramafica]|uniref:Uncharacterized protein n=1 Tax=Paraburkholderia ultramafica TaxID=1544867 RepID=A0A6S7BMQ9_9BURK|nr:hypothetical protein LMG28614_06006 [Paraburkholderia ultramafica]